jgi:HD-GYP domain-containing protein (c-di-GMP phosphodiesterase class II)
MRFDVKKLKRHRTYLLLVAALGACLFAGLAAHQMFLDAHEEWIADQSHVSADQAATAATSRLLERIAIHAFGFLWILIPQGVAAWLLVNRLRGADEREKLQSQEEAMRTAKELLMTRDAVVFGLAKLAESRDNDTGMHLERIALYSTRLASAMRRSAKYRDVVNANFVSNIGVSSALHDIGKVGVEDSLLLKPDRLTRDEHFRIQSHTQVGGECIRQIERRLGGSNFLEMAREIALFHHERWDGKGYPVGLAREEIPLAARVVAIADVYDALRSKRVYKDAKPHEDCVRIIREDAGKHFDPGLVEIFLSIQQQFREISERYADQASAHAVASRTQPTDRLTAEEARILAGVTEFTGKQLALVVAEDDVPRTAQTA